jgi:hypothetical protein
VRQDGTPVAKTSAKSAISSGHGLPLWAWVPIGLLVAVVALRTRVLLRQRAIRRRYPPRRQAW